MNSIPGALVQVEPITRLRPAFWKKKLRELGVQDVDDYINDRAHLSDKTISNLITLMVTMLRPSHGAASSSVPRTFPIT